VTYTGHPGEAGDIYCRPTHLEGPQHKTSGSEEQNTLEACHTVRKILTVLFAANITEQLTALTIHVPQNWHSPALPLYPLTEFEIKLQLKKNFCGKRS
jgi:hypothetical protein